MKKRLILLGVMFLVVLSIFSYAEEDTTSDSCSGFWGKLKCFFLGDAERREAIGGSDV